MGTAERFQVRVEISNKDDIIRETIDGLEK